MGHSAQTLLFAIRLNKMAEPQPYQDSSFSLRELAPNLTSSGLCVAPFRGSIQDQQEIWDHCRGTPKTKQSFWRPSDWTG